ncbi:putative HFM1/MER3 protein [Apodospora peruviana]|uniref:DNA 3'-5' helicase n=1 Tax=Apodospora peruviana TaxID=516989 RepID=A0AAE0I1I1_9PEZI|nr:putative HFM1/MER3 protein [Apodospora peruviana]
MSRSWLDELAPGIGPERHDARDPPEEPGYGNYSLPSPRLRPPIREYPYDQSSFLPGPPMSQPQYQHGWNDDGLRLDDFDRDLLSQPPLSSRQPQEEDEALYQLALSHLTRDSVPHISGHHLSNHHNTYNHPSSQSGFNEQSYARPSSYTDNPCQPSPRTRDIISHEPSHQLREMNGSLHQETPPLHSVPYPRNPPSEPSSTTSFLAPRSSSPSARVSNRKLLDSSMYSDAPSSASTGQSPVLQRTSNTHLTATGGSSTPVVQGVPLVSLRQALPDKLRAVFPYEVFNAVQSKCFNAVYSSTDNVVVSAPTGSGKTAILELAICKLAHDRGNQNFKIVYQAPTKALCSERSRDWEKKFNHMNLKCAELTGDTSQSEMRRVGDASIIITTPEKWDSITRKWQDHRRLLQLVELFLIDEVHILKDVRGATLEAVVSRMKTIGANVRFIALSATVPNSEDIAKWLGRNHTNPQLPAHRETFGEEFRPVKLQKFVYGFDCNGNDFIFDKFLDSKLPALLSRHTQRKPILVFCFTRKTCESTAAMLAEYASGRPADGSLWPIPSKRLPVVSRELQEIVKFGVAFHHAGLDVQDRNVVEQYFLKGQLRVICCTSTLAVGINLPCHTVVLKGTVGYTDDKLQEYSDLEIMQMLGRAGRPQFDDSATAIILTRKSNTERYKKMVSGEEILESTLHLNLIEHLNSEICLGTIVDLPAAKKWLGGTFLSVRLRRNPDYYRITEGTSNPTQIDDKLEEICERDIKQLQDAKLVTTNQKFRCTEYGRAMSKYMVEFSTMKEKLLQIPRGVGIEALITILSQASEFNDFRFKPAERALFREINKSPLIMFPIKETISQTKHKLSLMIQAHLGSVEYPDSSEAAKMRRQLMVEKKMVLERLQRLIRAVIDCKGYDRDATGTKNALELARALSAGSWEGRATQLTQVPNIGPVGMRKLASKGIRTVLELAEKDHCELEYLMSRQPPFGKNMQDCLEKFPHLDFDVMMVGHKAQPVRTGGINVNIKATLRYLNRKGPPNWLGRAPSITFLAESADGNLAYFWRGNMRKFDKHSGLELNFSTELRNQNDRIICHFTCEEIVGTMVTKALKHNLPDSSFPSKPNSAQRTLVGNPVYIDNDDLDDSDLVEAAELATSHLSSTKKTEEMSVAVDYQYDDGLDDDEYPPVEELLASRAGGGKSQYQKSDTQQAANDDDREGTGRGRRNDRTPVRLPNGKWSCNHHCSGGVLNKNGKPCTHKCCKDGVDKPKKLQPKKPKASKADEVDDWDSSKFAAVPTNSQLPAKAAMVGEEPPAKRQKLQPEITANQKETLTGSGGHPATKPTKPALKDVGFDDMDIECIDLLSDNEYDPFSNVDGGGVLDKSATKNPGSVEKSARGSINGQRPGKIQSRGRTLKGNSGGDIAKKEADSDTKKSSSSLQLSEAVNFSLARELGPELLKHLLITDNQKKHQKTQQVTPFKHGASDEVLYYGISGKFDTLGLDRLTEEQTTANLKSVKSVARSEDTAMPTTQNIMDRPMREESDGQRTNIPSTEHSSDTGPSVDGQL